MCQKEACCKRCAAEILGKVSVTVGPFVHGLLELIVSAFSSQTESFLCFKGLSVLPSQDVNLQNYFHTEGMFAYLLNILTNILGSLAFYYSV